MAKEQGYWKNVMNYGAITGFGVLMYMLVLSTFGFAIPLSSEAFTLIVLYLGMFYTLRYHRDKKLNGLIAYGKAVTMGFHIAFFASIILAFFTFIEYRINPEMAEKTVQLSLDQMKAMGFDDTQLQQAKATIQNKTAEFFAFSAVLGFSFYGLILALIVAAFLKRNPETTI